MRLSALLIRLATFALAGVGAFFAAKSTVAIVESRSVIAVQETLVDQGYEWVSVLGDGLQVILEGTAPTEADSFRAASAAGAVVDASRVIDNLFVADSQVFAPPEFQIEILRNDSGISLIGLIPAASDKEALTDQIMDIADGQPVADFLEAADYEMPENWRNAITYSLRALELLPRSKISVNARRVDISAISDSPEEKARLERALARSRPEGLPVGIEISAPRPVISPFTTRFTIDETGPHFDACAVDTQEALSQIIAAAAQAGFGEDANCTFALGAPSRTWGEAVALSISAVSDLGGGIVTVSDTDVTLFAPLGTEQSVFDDVVGELENALPDAFALSSELPVVVEVSNEGPPQFTATRSPEGDVQLRGRVPDAVTNTVAENFAIAKFGQNQLTMGTRVVDGLPSGWSVRVLAGIEALSELSNGAVIVEPDTVTVRGNTGNQEASGAISRLLIDKLGQTAKFEIDVTYVEQLDPIAGLPTPEECVSQIKVVTESRKITFDPSSADISASAQAVVDDIAEILKLCGDLRIEVAGYTDSQGREEMNLNLSQQRAGSVLTALRSRRVPVGTFRAVGYGEENPIADNDTEEGREANRRIEFSLIVPESTVEETNALDELAAPPPEPDPEPTVEDAPSE